MKEVYISKNIVKIIEDLIDSSCTSEEFKAKMKLYTDPNQKTISFDSVVEIRDEIKRIHKQDENKQVPYLHELLEGCEIKIPKFELPPRNPELEARIQRLKAEQANREYKEMTKNVSHHILEKKENTFGQDAKNMNSQLIAVFNFLLTIGGAFAFGYKATEYSMVLPNVPIQLCVGMVFGTVVFFADLYFLVKYNL
ncbi:vacuolar ATPase assembly protein VMA12-like [Tubulanus polymorphus]|uniref:vacuolar ATPase assembly protein VMA12-like n=1 Tax=Tubulanus polymorphus TaxID=672921 RepID=UPI003DA5CED0